MDHRMTRPARLTQTHPAHAGLLPKRLDRTVSWSDFRTRRALRPDEPAAGRGARHQCQAGRAPVARRGRVAAHAVRRGRRRPPRVRARQDPLVRAHRRPRGARRDRGAMARGRRRRLVPRPADDRRAAARRLRRSRRRRGGGGIAHFEGGTIAWTARHGAAIVHGMVRDIWALLGWEQSALGVPVRTWSSTRSPVACAGASSTARSRGRRPGVAEVSVTTRAVAGEALDREALGGIRAGFAPRA